VVRQDCREPALGPQQVVDGLRPDLRVEHALGGAQEPFDVVEDGAVLARWIPPCREKSIACAAGPARGNISVAGIGAQ
jgi:hypothetical protein